MLGGVFDWNKLKEEDLLTGQVAWLFEYVPERPWQLFAAPAHRCLYCWGLLVLAGVQSGFVAWQSLRGI